MNHPPETSSRAPQKRQSVRSGLAWMFSSQGMLSVLHVAVLMVLARLLSTAEFGVATVFLAVAQVCGILATLGFGPALVQSQEATARHVAAALNIALWGGLLFGLGIYLYRLPLATLLGVAEQAGLFWLFLPLCCAAGLNLVLRSVMQRERRFRGLSTIEAVSYLLAYAVPAILLAWQGYGALAVVTAFTLNMSVNVIACFILLRPSVSLWLDVRAARDLSRTGLGFGLSELISISTQNLDKLLVSGLLGSAAVGLYGRASALMQTGLTVLSAPLDAVMFPTFSQAQHDPERLRELLRKTHILVFLLALPVALIMTCAPDGLILILLGTNWLEAAPLLQVFGVLILIRVNGRALDFVLRAKGLVYRRLLLTVVFSILTVGFIVWGAGYGLVGVAVGVAVAFLVHALLIIRLVVAELRMSWREYLGLVLPPLLWGLLLGGLLLGLLNSRWSGDWHPVARLLVTALLVAIIMGWSLRFRPGLIFGRHGKLARGLMVTQTDLLRVKLAALVDRLRRKAD